MTYKKRPYQSWHDLQIITDLAYGHGSNLLHVIDLPYRLASWTLDKPQNFRFWYDHAENIAAVAIVQEAFLALEYIIHPAADKAFLEPDIVRWGLQRGQEIANEQATTFPINVWLSDDPPQPDRVSLLEENGLALSSRKSVTLQCDLSNIKLPNDKLVPTGIKVRR